MAITQADFNKIWASTSPLTPYEFSENNYKQGWNFVGATPPSRQMWDFQQKQNDEKAQWLYNAHNEILDLLKKLIPIGVVQAYAGNTVPNGWLLCDGSAVSRTDYAELYAVIGDTYGAGDGVDTFNLPNLVDKFVEGSATAGTVKSAGLPNLSGYIAKRLRSDAMTSDASGPIRREIVSESDSEYPAMNTGGSNASLYFDASLGNSIYGNSTTVQPPALTMQYIIKY